MIPSGTLLENIVKIEMRNMRLSFRINNEMKSCGNEDYSESFVKKCIDMEYNNYMKSIMNGIL